MRSEIALALRKWAMRSSFDGRFPVAQRILRRVFSGAKGIARVDDFDGSLSIDLRLSEHMQSRIFWVGYYSREIVNVLNKILREGMVVVDVGANIGEITMVASKRVGSSGRVLAFEPVARNLLELNKNIRENALRNVTIIESGLSDYEGEVHIYHSCGQGAENDEHFGLNSIYVGSGEGIPIQSIPLTTLDRFLQSRPQDRIDVVKIDIEGAELACLKGSEQTLRSFRPYLIIEVQRTSSAAGGYEQSDILNFLSPLGYSFFRISSGGKLSAVQAGSLSEYQNVLCVHESVVDSFT
jgi:FkbM family methyltransferase